LPTTAQWLELAKGFQENPTLPYRTGATDGNCEIDTHYIPTLQL